MKLLGLDLDNSPHIATNKSLRYAKNITIDSKSQSYFNERGFETYAILDDIFKINKAIFNNRTNHSFNIIGTIPTNIGVVLFVVIECYNINNSGNKTDIINNDCIIYFTNEHDIIDIKKVLYGTESGLVLNNNSVFNFNINRPIHGDYIYNYKSELVITFTEGISDDANETRIINLDNPFYENIEIPIFYEITKDECESFNLIPNIIYPELKCEVNDGGNLKTGAYQIAIKYKLNDGTYTNYSPLSTSLIVCGTYGLDYKPGIEINRKLEINFKVVDTKYNTYKLAIVYITDEAQLCYETDDILIGINTYGKNVNYIISDVSYFETISLDDIFIKNVGYIKDATLVNFNNRLIRGNVKTINYKDLDNKLKEFTKTGFNITTTSRPANSMIDTNERYFKSGEVYVLYAGYFDYKGALINIYNIPWQDGSNTDKFIIDNKGNTGFKIRYITKDDSLKITVPWQRYPTTSIDNWHNTSDSSKNIVQVINVSSIPNDLTYNNETLKIEKLEIPNYKFKSPIYGTIDTKTIAIKITNISNNYINCAIPHACNNYKNNNSKPGKRLKITSRVYDISDYNNTDIIYNLSKVISEKIVTESLDIQAHMIYNDFLLPIKSNESKIIFIENITEIEFNTSETPTFTQFDYNYDNTHIYSPNIKYLNLLKTTIKNIPSDISKIVKNVAFFFIEHNINNSRILSQGFSMRETKTNQFGNNQTYDGQFGGEDLRFYPFEYLYNKIAKLKGKLFWIGDIGSNYNIDWIKIGKEELGNSVVEYEGKGFDDNGTKFLDIDVDKLSYKTTEKLTSEFTLEYINQNNSSQDNVAGDSFYKIKNGYQTYNKYSGDLATSSIGDLVNSAEILYSDINNQKLQIASSLLELETNKSTFLNGDTYIGYLTLRATTPSAGYRYGDAQKKELDSNATVYRWVFIVPIESKYNILARFGNNNIDKPFNYHKKVGSELKELFTISYQVDNFINTNVGKGYSTIYNENGIESFSYFDEIPGTQNHPFRIIRSQLQSAENANLNWRLFRSDDYKDIPFNRGFIIALKTNNKNLYIQQEFGLHLLQLRDTLSNTDEGTSYLGTADIFNMEPQEVTYSPSGYIGCQSYFDTHINVIGYFVIDSVHKRIFNIDGSKVSNITALNCLKWFDENLELNANNPFNNNGRIWVFNEDVNILYLVQNCENNKFTISYSPILNAWLSFHSYIPIAGITNRNGLFWFDNQDIYKISKNNYGRYLKNKLRIQEIDKSYIQFTLNDNTIYNKLLNNITWKDRVDIVKNLIPQYNEFIETINSIMIHNDNQCSGYKEVKFNMEWYQGDTGVNKINLWRFNNIFDIHKSIPFMKDALVIDEMAIKHKAKWYDINKFICQFIYCTMIFNNNDPKKLWELIEINPEWIIDNRNNQ